MWGGGCKREVECADYAGSCPGGVGTAARWEHSGDAAAECTDNGAGCLIPGYGLVKRVFVPTGTEPGECWGIYKCEKDGSDCGDTAATYLEMAHATTTGNTWPATQYCDGVETSSDSGWTGPEEPEHGFDDETYTDDGGATAKKTPCEQTEYDYNGAVASMKLAQEELAYCEAQYWLCSAAQRLKWATVLQKAEAKYAEAVYNACMRNCPWTIGHGFNDCKTRV